MRKGKDTSRKPLFTVTGKSVGEIKDLFLDSELTEVVAVVTGSTGLIHRRHNIIERKDIKVYGPDAWLVADGVVPVEAPGFDRAAPLETGGQNDASKMTSGPGQDDAGKIESVPGQDDASKIESGPGQDDASKMEASPGPNTPLLLSKLRDREVRTEGGTLVGVFEDVILDAEARVIGIALSRVYASGPISERRAIARGAMTGFGSKDTPMTTILAKAETMLIPED